MNFSARILDWYDRSARTLPWRVPPGSDAVADPYRVWLAEVMLQQTTVAAVAGYFTRFTERWPTVAALSAADDDDVMAARSDGRRVGKEGASTCSSRGSPSP